MRSNHSTGRLSEFAACVALLAPVALPGCASDNWSGAVTASANCGPFQGAVNLRREGVDVTVMPTLPPGYVRAPDIQVPDPNHPDAPPYTLPRWENPLPASPTLITIPGKQGYIPLPGTEAQPPRAPGRIACSQFDEKAAVDYEVNTPGHDEPGEDCRVDDFDFCSFSATCPSQGLFPADLPKGIEVTLQLGGGEWEPEAGDIIPQGARVQVKGDLAGAVDTLEALGFRSFDSKYGRVIISYAEGHGGWPLALVIDAKGKVVNGRLIGMER